MPYVDEDFGTIVDGWFARADAILLGRTTYEMMHPYWRQVTDPHNLVATELNGLPKYVVSTTLTDPIWEHTTVISDDVVDAVARLKDTGDGELQVHGSSGLATTLQEAGLVDEYRLLVFPVLVGDGKRLFSGAAAASGLTLVRSTVTGAGVLYPELTPTPFSVGRVGVEDGHEVEIVCTRSSTASRRVISDRGRTRRPFAGPRAGASESRGQRVGGIATHSGPRRHPSCSAGCCPATRARDRGPAPGRLRPS